VVRTVQVSPRRINRALHVGAVSSLWLLAGFVAGILGLLVHGLGYFAAYPFWLVATGLAAWGVRSAICTHRDIDRRRLPASTRPHAAVGLASSSVMLFLSGMLTLSLTGLLGLGAFVAFGMLVSHPY